LKSALLSIHHNCKSFYIILGFFLFWQVIPFTGLVDPHFVPPLSKVLAESIQLGFANIAIDISISLGRVIIGFIMAAAVALPLGFILAGAFPKLARLLNPLMVFLSQVPPFILFPVFVIIFGVGNGGIYTVIFWSAIWPLLFNTIAGTQLVDPLLIKSARSMGAGQLTIFFKVIVPGALASIMIGTRTAITICFMMLIGAETMGANSGLGWLIHQSQRMAMIPRIYFAVLLVAVIGLLINYLIEWLERNIIVWQEDTAEELIEWSN